MAKNINEFLGKGKGDIVTLSDLQTQQEFGKLKVDFLIKETRTYSEPSGSFTYHCYLAEYDPEEEGREPQTILLMIRQMGEEYDLRVFYMDNDGASADFEPLFTTEEVSEEEISEGEGDDEEVTMIEIEIEESDFDEEATDEEEAPDSEGEKNGTITSETLVERFEVTIHLDGNDLPVTWDIQQGSPWFGVETRSSESGQTDQKTIVEYFTNDETGGNPHCFIEWTGDIEDGYIEIWYGCEVRPEDVEIFKTK